MCRDGTGRCRRTPPRRGRESGVESPVDGRAPTHAHVVREMARCLRAISEVRVPR